MTQKKVARAVLDQDKPFLFKYKNKAYRLPPATKAIEGLGSGVWLDLAEAEESKDVMSILRCFNRIIKHAAPGKEAEDALRALSLEDFIQVVGDYIGSAGVEPGES